jgi:hypothetical protein
LQPGDNTDDCNILKSVVATTDVLRLQKRAKKTVAKTSMWVIATLPQCGCTLIAVCLRLKKTVAETGKKCDCKNPVQKKLHVMTLSDCD